MHYTPKSLSRASCLTSLNVPPSVVHSHIAIFQYFRRLASTTPPPNGDGLKEKEDQPTEPLTPPNSRSKPLRNPRYRYPFPTKPHPTAHDIFHLPPHTPSHVLSKQALKSRYYELVKEHHPDCAMARAAMESSGSPVSKEELRRRFQLIGEAWEVLSGRKRMMGYHSPLFRGSNHSANSSASSANSWSTGAGSSSHAYNHGGFGARDFSSEWAERAEAAEENADDRWKDRVIMAVGITVRLLSIQIHPRAGAYFNTFFHLGSIRHLLSALLRCSHTKLSQMMTSGIGTLRPTSLRRAVTLVNTG